MKKQPNAAPWVVRPDYGKENVYRLWNKNTNYHEDTSPERMDANANLMSFAPRLLSFVKLVSSMMTQNEFGDNAPASEDCTFTLDLFVKSARNLLKTMEGGTK
jgi:hypothetical protein